MRIFVGLAAVALLAGCSGFSSSAAAEPGVTTTPTTATSTATATTTASTTSPTPTPGRGPLAALRRVFSTYAPSGADYELDPLDRTGPERGSPMCPRESLVTYRGIVVRYEVPASVHPAFAERLLRFERVAREVAIEIYGRPPKVLHHGGAFACRVTYRGRMSEHAFGNALDVAGFSFDPIGAAELAKLRERGAEVTRAERRAFRVDVGPAWASAGPANAKRFYALLLEKLRAREDVFRGMIGPPDPAHTTHLHLDVGPWGFSRYESPVVPPS